MTGENSVMKELYKLLRRAKKLFDGQVEVILDEGQTFEREDEDLILPDNVVKFYLIVTPKDGLYKNASCKFRVFVDDGSYPQSPPYVQCLNNIYHPNIEFFTAEFGDWTLTNVCVNLLGEDWQPEVGLDGCVMAILFLFYNPQIDDALSTSCCDFENEEEYEETLRKTLLGGEVDGFEYDKLLNYDEEEEEKTDKEELTSVTVAEPQKLNENETVTTEIDLQKADVNCENKREEDVNETNEDDTQNKMKEVDMKLTFATDGNDKYNNTEGSSVDLIECGTSETKEENVAICVEAQETEGNCSNLSLSVPPHFDNPQVGATQEEFTENCTSVGTDKNQETEMVCQGSKNGNRFRFSFNETLNQWFTKLAKRFSRTACTTEQKS